MRYSASEERRLFSKAKNCFAFRSIVEQIIILRARLIARFFDLGRVWARARAIARPLGQGLLNNESFFKCVEVNFSCNIPQ